MFVRLAATALATTLFTSAAWAQAPEVDADGSRSIELSEFRSALGRAGIFDRWDTDDEEGLAPSEFVEGLYGLWDRNGDGELQVDEWDNSVDRWFGEADVNLAVERWDDNSDDVISSDEFEEALSRTNLFARLDEDGNGMLDEQEFGRGLFETGDLDDDMAIGVEEDDGFWDLLFPDDDDGLFADDAEAAGLEEPSPIEADEEELSPPNLIERGESYVELPIPCGSGDGSATACEDLAARFCRTLGYQPPIDFLAVEGRLYVVRCRDEP